LYNKLYSLYVFAHCNWRCLNASFILASLLSKLY
jgi:hypothetical protein